MHCRWCQSTLASNDLLIVCLCCCCLEFFHTQPKDLDSIDRLDDDCVDAIALGKGGKQQKKGPSDDNKGENEKTVTCLYYALQCCDCTIS